MICDSKASGLLVCLATFSLVSCDTVAVQNASGDVGLLVDGEARGVAVNDRGFTASGTGNVSVNVGSLRSGPDRNEAIGFGLDRAPVRISTPWTSWYDDFVLPLSDPIYIPVTVWIVQGPFNDQYLRVVDSSVQASLLWDAERVGIRFSVVVVRDATSDPDITNAILNSTGGNWRNWDDYSTHIGLDPGRINIYWINTVDGSSSWGWSDFHARIVMGKNTSFDLFAHEIGHAFRLFHPADCGQVNADFDNTNLMWQCSTARDYAAEGQTFRAHFNTASAINNLYLARPGQPTAGCDGHAQTKECPAVERRLWPDGLFAAQVP